MVAPAMALMVAVPASPLTVMVGAGTVNVTTSSDTEEATPPRTVTALMVTGEVEWLERSKALPPYTVPVVAVGSVPVRV